MVRGSGPGPGVCGSRRRGLPREVLEAGMWNRQAEHLRALRGQGKHAHEGPGTESSRIVDSVHQEAPRVSRQAAASRRRVFLRELLELVERVVAVRVRGLRASGRRGCAEGLNGDSDLLPHPATEDAPPATSWCSGPRLRGPGTASGGTGASMDTRWGVRFCGCCAVRPRGLPAWLARRGGPAEAQ